MNKTSVVRENPALVGVPVGKCAVYDWVPAETPSTFQNVEFFEVAFPSQFDYGLVVSSHPEFPVHSDIDRRPISHVGMFAPILGTPHPGWYLSKQ
jgi:hypothetical protein